MSKTNYIHPNLKAKSMDSDFAVVIAVQESDGQGKKLIQMTASFQGVTATPAYGTIQIFTSDDADEPDLPATSETTGWHLETTITVSSANNINNNKRLSNFDKVNFIGVISTKNSNSGGTFNLRLNVGDSVEA